MPIQYEIPILASLGAPKDELTAWVHATSFEECVRLAFERGRKFIGAELKDSYFRQAVANLDSAQRQTNAYAANQAVMPPSFLVAA